MPFFLTLFIIFLDFARVFPFFFDCLYKNFSWTLIKQKMFTINSWGNRATNWGWNLLHSEQKDEFAFKFTQRIVFYCILYFSLKNSFEFFSLFSGEIFYKNFQFYLNIFSCLFQYGLVGSISMSALKLNWIAKFILHFLIFKKDVASSVIFKDWFIVEVTMCLSSIQLQ